MNILGIDPGTGRTGWGTVRKLKIVNSGKIGGKNSKLKVEEDKLEYIAHGCIITNQEDLMHNSLLELHLSINKIIKEYSPDCVVIEQIFFGRNTKTAISVGQARGVIMLSAAIFNIPVFEYTGISVKYYLSGYGRSDKKIMQKTVRRILRTDKRKLPFNTKDKGFDDSADALAIAIYHALKNDHI